MRKILLDNKIKIHFLSKKRKISSEYDYHENLAK